MRPTRSASDAADDRFPPEPGAFIMRPDGTRAFRNHALRDQHGRTVRFQDDLIPFDVIPCRPAGGFLQFIADTLAAGHTVRAVRTVTTSPRPS